MTREEMAKALVELMNKFDEYRAKWIAEFGNDEGFGEWFFTQAAGEKK